MSKYLERRIFFIKALDIAAAVFILVCLTAYLFIQLPKISAVFKPAEKTNSASRLLSVCDKGAGARVSLSVNRSDVFVVRNELASDGELTGICMLVKLDDKYVLVIAPPKYCEQNAYSARWSFTGTLKDFDGEAQKALEEARKRSDLKNAGLDEKLIPYSVDCGVSAIGLIEGIAVIVVAVIIVFGMLMFIKRRVKRNKRYEIANDTDQYGDFEAIADSIDKEISEKVLFRTTNMKMTKSWIVHRKSSRSKLNIISLDKVIWGYRRIIRSLLYCDNELVLKDSFGNTFRISILSKRKIKRILKYLRTQYPWVAIGYNEQLETMYRNGELEKIVKQLRTGKTSGDK